MYKRLSVSGRLRVCACVIALFSAAIIGSHSTQAANTDLAVYQLERGWATFGLVLPRGAARGSLKVGQLPTQTDVKTTWPDGSIRFAVVTARVDAPGHFPVRVAAAASGNFVPTWPSAQVAMGIGGQLYVARLPAFNDSNPWLSGSLVNESRAITTPHTAGGAAHPFLRAVWDVRCYANDGCRVDLSVGSTLDIPETQTFEYDSIRVTVAGTQVFERLPITPNAPLSYDAATHRMSATNSGVAVGDVVTITSGPAVGRRFRVFSMRDSNSFAPGWNELPSTSFSGASWKITLTHPMFSRWRQVFRTGGLIESEQVPDFEPFYAAEALPRYLPTVANPTYDISDRKFDIFHVGDNRQDMQGHSGRPELGPFPDWTSQYLVHRTSNLRQHFLRQGDLAGSWSVHFTNSEDPSDVVSIAQRPYYVARYSNSKSDGAANNFKDQSTTKIGAVNPIVGGLDIETAHVPSFAFAQYLVTGDRYYLDENRAWTAATSLWNYTNESADYRRGTDGLIGAYFYTEVRGIGWSLRLIGDATAYLPDSEIQLKSAWRNQLLKSMEWLDLVATPGAHPWGGVVNGVARDFPARITAAPYHDFLYKGGYRSALGFVFPARRPESSFSSPTFNNYDWVALWEQNRVAWAIDRVIGHGLATTEGRIMQRAIVSSAVSIANAAPHPPSGLMCPFVWPIYDYTTHSDITSMSRAYEVAMAADAVVPGGALAGLPGNYAKDCRLSYMMASNLGVPGAQMAYDYLMGYPGQRADLNRVSGWAIVHSGRNSTSRPPASPTNVRLIP